MKNKYWVRRADLRGIREISREAFSGCTGLQTVLFERLKRVEKYAFRGCSRLQELEFPSVLGRIGTGAFLDNRRLASVLFQRDCEIRELSPEIFSGCQSLERVRLPRRLETVGCRTFYKCQSLRELELPLTLKTIGEEAFYGCGFRELELPEGLLSIEEGAFRKCRELEYIYLPDSLRRIGKWVFHGCTRLKILEINHDPEEIGPWITNRNCVIRCPKGSGMEAYAREYGMDVEYI